MIFGKIRASFRLIAFAIITLTATFFIYFGRLFGAGNKWSFYFFNHAISAIRSVLNIRVKYRGNPPSGSCLILSNHRSYIDIVLIPSETPYVIVAKKEVSRWPIIGLAAKAVQVIFVNRQDAQNRRKVRDQILNRIKKGFSVLIYPEGTTFQGPGILPFKPGMFGVAASEKITIYPVAIEFKEKNMAWIGDDTFIPHFFRAFSRRRIDVDVSFGQAISGDNADVLREKTFGWIDGEVRMLAG